MCNRHYNSVFGTVQVFVYKLDTIFVREKDTIKILVGGNIAYYRAKAGYTQQVFSELIGCDIKYLGDIENGWNYPSSKLLIKIVEVLEIPVSILFTPRNL